MHFYAPARFYDFITLPQNDWNDKVKKTYNKIKIAEKFDQMPNLEGKHICKITKNDEKKARNIKNDIYAKSEIFRNLDKYFDELLLNLDKISVNFKNISNCFKELEINIKIIIY